MLMIFIFFFFLLQILSRPLIKIERTPITSLNNYKWDTNICQKSNEPCFYKDISYNMDVKFENQIYSLSLDLTIQRSWIKGKDQCENTGYGSKRCKLIKQSSVQQITKTIKHIKQSLSVSQIENIQHKQNLQMIGSLQTIKGFKQKDMYLSYNNQGSYFTLINQSASNSQKLDSQNDNNPDYLQYLNASLVNQILGRIEDGGISLKFKQFKQSDFIKQLFQSVNETRAFISFFINKNSFYTIGNIPQQYVIGGQREVQWLKNQDNQQFNLNSFTIKNKQVYSQTLKIVQNKNVYFTLSASYLSFPEPIISFFIKQFSHYRCTKTLNAFVQCSDIDSQFLNSLIVIQINSTKLKYKLGDLTNYQKHASTVLKIRQSDFNNIILGQPHFQKYMTSLDFKQKRIGFGHKYYISEIHSQQSKSNIFIIIVIVFFFGCLLILFFSDCCEQQKHILQIILKRNFQPKIVSKSDKFSQEQVQNIVEQLEQINI